MSYDIQLHPEAREQIADLSPPAAQALAAALTRLETAPWEGLALDSSRPETSLRTLAFGPEQAGLLAYSVLPQQRRVEVWRVLWTG